MRKTCRACSGKAATMADQNASVRPYKAVCFDLDGTLLPFDMKEFLDGYFARLATFMVAKGADPARLKESLNAGTYAMTKNNGPHTNEAVYWSTFMALINKDVPAEQQRSQEEWVALFTEFYETQFSKIGQDVQPSQHMINAVATLAAKGYPLLLTTMPLFPPLAVKLRLGWAGLDAGLFCRLTNYENSRAAKPSLRYYAENLAAMGLSGHDVLMVGNNTVEDLAFCKLGADAYLVTDFLLDPVGLDLQTVKHGTFADFAAWVQQLPDCADPVGEVATGALDVDLIDAVLQSNAQLSADQQQAAQREAAAAERFNAQAAGELAPAPAPAE